MSDRTPEERAVEDAIVEALRVASPGSIVTGWVLVLQTTVPEDVDSTAFVHDTASGQSLALTLGLIEVTGLYHRRRMGQDR